MSSGRSAHGKTQNIQLNSLHSYAMDIDVMSCDTISGDVIFENPVTFSSNVTFASIAVYGRQTVTSHFDVGGDASITGDLKVNGACTLTSIHGTTASFTGNMTIGGMLSLTSNDPPSVGTGFDGAEACDVMVRRENHEIITTIYVDIGDGGDVDIVSDGSANTVIGENNANPAYLTQITTAVNGIIYRVELTVLENPAGADLNIDLYGNTSGSLAKGGDVTSGTSLQLIDGSGFGGHSAGRMMFHAAKTFTAGLDTYYIYLAHAGTTAETYTAGKWMLKFFGSIAPDI
jgi:hypothetical protein